MREKAVEQKLTLMVKKAGRHLSEIHKSRHGRSSRQIGASPGGKIAFIELKAEGRRMRPLQVRRKRQLEGLGFSVYCIDRPEQIGEILDEIQSS